MMHNSWWKRRRALKQARSLLKQAFAVLARGDAPPDGTAPGNVIHRKTTLAARELEEKLQAQPEDWRLLERLTARLDSLLVQGGHKKKKGTVRQYAESIAWALAIALVVRFFLFEPFRIPTGSMIPTLQIGDHIFVSKSAYGIRIPLANRYLVMWKTPEPGDVVVFPFPVEGDEDHGKDFIKRVVGLPGQRIALVDNVLHIDGKPIRVNRNKGLLVDSCPGIPMMSCQYVQMEETLGSRTYITHHCHRLSCENRDSWPTPGASWSWPPDEASGPYVVPEGHLLVMGDNRDNSRDGREWGLVPLQSIKGRARIVWLARDRSRMFSRIP